MPGIRKTEIAARLAGVLRENAFRVVSSGMSGSRRSELPWMCTVESGARVRGFRCYFWTVTHGGNHRSSSEYRIQTMLSTDERRLAFGAGTTLLLGYYRASLDAAAERLEHSVPGDMEVLVAWDPTLHIRLGYSSSCQVPWEQLLAAYVDGVSATTRAVTGGTEQVIAMRLEYFPSYLLEAAGGHDEVDARCLRIGPRLPST